MPADPASPPRPLLLLVDDDYQIRQLLLGVGTREGFEVLVTGETGTGKELVARALHALGPRKKKKLVTVNCSAVVETLFESELLARSSSERPALTSVADEDPAGPPPAPEQVRTALDGTGGNKSLAATRLGISRRALYRLTDKYDLTTAPLG